MTLARVGETVDAGLFGPGSVTWRLHSDATTMVVGGLRALLVQACHPLTMAGFADNTRMWQDPWGRMLRTGEFVAQTTFGTTAEAEAAGARLRRVHARLPGGVEPETGLSYRVDDPDLLLWVHCTEVESFLSTFRRSGGGLSGGDGDRYVDEMRVAARLVGLDPKLVPATVAEIEDYYADVRRQLRVTAVARREVLAGLLPAMPRRVELLTPARPAWVALVGVAAGLLPRWTRRLYGLPGLPTTDLSAALAARALRTTLAALPGGWAQSPAHRAALERVATAPAPGSR